MVDTKGGIVVLNKEINISSNTAVNKVKHLLKVKKAGHLGTLDVLGEGVLPITLNKATRLFDYFLKKDKTYRAVFVFGIETTTLDCEGEITNIDYVEIDRKKIEKALLKFVGKIQQIPPQYSALKVGGKTAYDLARSGEQVDLKPREIEIYSFKLLEEVKSEINKRLVERFFNFHNIDLLENSSIKKSFQNNVFEFEITCSSGTYIRSLCHDLAKELTTCGTMLSIIRTRCGDFKIEEAVRIKDIENGDFNIVDVDRIINLPSINIDEKSGKDILDGKKVKHLPIQNEAFKLYCNDVFYGIANNKNDGEIKIEVNLKEV